MKSQRSFKKLADKYLPISRVWRGLEEKTLATGLQINKSVSSKLRSNKDLAMNDKMIEVMNKI